MVLHTSLLVDKRLSQRRSVQLAGGVLLAAVLPWALRVIALGGHASQVVTTSAIGNLVAVLLGFYVFRSMTNYPGIRPGFYILPIVSATFGIVLVAFISLRLDYSRFVLITGYLLACSWYLAIFTFSRRSRSLSVAVVPFGDYRKLFSISGFAWTTLSQPVAPAMLAYDCIVADFRADMPEQWEAFLAECALAGIPVYHTKQLRESITGRVQIDHLSENSFGSLMPNSPYKHAKFLGDALLALIALAVLFVPMMIVAVLIRMDSPGPALFRQARVGLGGHVFQIYKFRTMRIAAPDAVSDTRDAAMTKDADPRITRIGRFLRRSRIDELPQIINVLRGEMSWIGPRPEAMVLAEWYQSDIPFYSYRHIVRPGITGWAQVRQGHVADVECVTDKLHYDFYYVKNFSPWLDILILTLTVRTILTGFGSR